RPPPPGHEPGDHGISRSTGSVNRRTGRNTICTVERHGGEGAPAVWRALEVQRLTRQLAVHRRHAVVGTCRELEHHGRPFERRARTPGETRRSCDTLRGRTQRTET